MVVRLVSATVAAAMALGMVSVESSAGERRHLRRGPAYDHFYAGPEVVRAVPGLRLLFGDYALSEEEYDALYGQEEPGFDETYYEPEIAVPTKPQKKKAETKPGAATASVAPPPATPPKPVASAPKSAAGLSCDKAASIITGYGFSAVKPKTCAGKVYAFNASRDGKPFAIKLDSGSGELTEVKKLQ